MTVAGLILGAAFVGLVFCSVLLIRKLVEMLTSKKPYWLRREGCVDKATQQFTHAFWVFVIAFGLLVSLGLIALVLWAALHP